MKSVLFFLLFIMLKEALTQSLPKCNEIPLADFFLPKKQDCISVSTEDKETACCYLEYSESSIRKRKCIEIKNTKKDIKSVLSQYSNAKISCKSSYIKISKFFILIYFLIVNI